MVFNQVNFLRHFVMIAAACVGFDALAVQAPNPRGSSVPTSNVRTANDSSSASRAAVMRTVSRAGTLRPATQGAVVSNARRGGASVARAAMTGATIHGASARNEQSVSAARTATTPNISRAGVARATAVFSDVSKIGGGYAACRDAYATCMDQFCANANDTYRRCYCSSRFTEFRNTESALDQAKTLLMRFEDNNLNAVDKTAAEVNAMYSATVGEAAIKNDTSAAAKMLDEIGDLLSGKKKTYTATKSSTSLGILSFDLSGDVDDIWSNGGNSIFSGGGQNMSELEGTELYNAANNQCSKIVSESCGSTPVANMARSSYSILITQDCNAYQKNIDKKVEAVKQTVRTAEKYLREARLEEYRSHNSADVNECITKVRAAVQNDAACGANYKRCLDYTGAYINQNGDANYTPRLFQLTDIIKLSGVTSDAGGDMDVLAQNPEFDRFLETRKMFATSALDTCRSIANVVWEEFKRTALIEIAQAQDEKIEEVKMSCVSTMADCYDTQSSALKSFDNTTAQMAGALSAYAAKQMCIDKVSACAALYSQGSNAVKCEFGEDGKLLNESACGLGALLDFVNTVDNIRIAEGCETALKNYATKLCTPDDGSEAYPWNCRFMSSGEIQDNLEIMAKTYCNPDVIKYESDTIKDTVSALVRDIARGVSQQMMEECEKTANGIWVDADDERMNKNYTPKELETEFYHNVYGTSSPKKDKNQDEIKSYGKCIKNTIKARCDMENEHTGNKGYAKYYEPTNTCQFTVEYYQYQCKQVDGQWEANHCYIDNDLVFK